MADRETVNRKIKDAWLKLKAAESELQAMIRAIEAAGDIPQPTTMSGMFIRISQEQRLATYVIDAAEILKDAADAYRASVAVCPDEYLSVMSHPLNLQDVPSLWPEYLGPLF